MVESVGTIAPSLINYKMLLLSLVVSPFLYIFFLWVGFASARSIDNFVNSELHEVGLGRFVRQSHRQVSIQHGDWVDHSYALVSTLFTMFFIYFFPIVVR